MGVPGCPSGARAPLVGWCGTTVVERPWFAVEKSAEVVLPAGSLIAGKDRTRSRGAGRSCSWDWMLNAANPARGLDGRVRR